MSDPFVGEIRMVGFPFAPVGWALCNGQILSIAQNAALFSLIGSTYGGDGRTTFALPNLQSRVPVHQGQGPGLSAYVLGEMAGAETVVLTVPNLPAHSHSLVAQTTAPTVDNPTNNYLATGTRQAPALIYTGGTTQNSTQMSAQAIGMTGANIPIHTVTPSLCVNFIIALVGIFPSRP